MYRTGTDSELMQILIDAARKGKEVTVVVELMARFDEEANLNWAARLEEVGAHVVYGVVGHKTHAKMALVVRREEARRQGAAPLRAPRDRQLPPARPRASTPTSACSPANEDICADVDRGVQAAHRPRPRRQDEARLAVAVHAAQAHRRRHPRTKRSTRAEGKPARIIAKMNALLEPQIIEELYAASTAGREDRPAGARRVRAASRASRASRRTSACARSIGRFLEHSRVFYFSNGGADDVYLASADWMDRNFFRRIELCFPVLDPALKRRVIREGLQPYLDDNCQAWVMNADGGYERLRPRKGAVAARRRKSCCLR